MVGVLTFIHHANYGSCLQAYALLQALHELGQTAGLIDYQPDAREKVHNLLHSGNNPVLALEGLRKRRIPGYAEKQAATDAFLRERVTITPPCRSVDELRRAAAACDTLLVGADQVWNPRWFNPVYLLPFAGEGQRRVAYAASMGETRHIPAYKKARIQAGLRPFQAISLREEAGCAFVNQLPGHVEAQRMPDPVFLLEPGQWRMLADGSPTDQPYLLWYLLRHSARDELLAQLRAEAGKRTWLATPGTAPAQRLLRAGAAQPGRVSVTGFLGDVAHAALLVTDSFHGAALATLLGVPVRLVCPPDVRLRQLQVDVGADLVQCWQPNAASLAKLHELRIAGRAWLRQSLQ